MGRYTTVQTYSDNNPNLVLVPYEQATAQKEPAEGGLVKKDGGAQVYVGGGKVGDPMVRAW